jgi:hypothetical protein
MSDDKVIQRKIVIPDEIRGLQPIRPQPTASQPAPVTPDPQTGAFGLQPIRPQANAKKS